MKWQHCLVVWVSMFLGQGLAWSDETRPNVLFIAVDDLNDWIGVLEGHPQARTPNIDRLAQRGVLFTNAHCAAPACNPSRVALMTGLRPSTSGVYQNQSPWRKALPDAVTLPQHFMAHGYTALGSGKIYHGRFPDPPSWDEYWPSKEKQKPNDPMPENRPLNGIPGTAHFDWGPVNASDEAMGDAQVGRVLDALDESPHAGSTIIVFWTDHGWHLGEKEHWRKFALWEDATRTPIVVVAPGVTEAGARCARPINLLDLYPTLIDLCRLPERPELEGASLRPLLEDVAAERDRPSLTTHGRNNHALCSDRYRYIRYSDGSEELYDHKHDPHEWRNVADDANYADVKAELARWLPKKNVPEIRDRE